MLHPEEKKHVQNMTDKELYDTINIIDLRKKEGRPAATITDNSYQPVAPGYEEYLKLLISELKKRGLPIP